MTHVENAVLEGIDFCVLSEPLVSDTDSAAMFLVLFV